MKGASRKRSAGFSRRIFKRGTGGSPVSQWVAQGQESKSDPFSSHWLCRLKPALHVWQRHVTLLFLLALVLFFTPAAFGVERFPPPDFSSHAVPLTVVPDPQTRGVAWLDVLVLSVGLGVASWLSLKQRSRRGIVILSLLSLAYFGFWRRGCVCAIGSIQNVALGIADPTYAVPLVVIALFVLPLVVALIWGRSFCAGVCPHGALQDLVLIKPLKVPTWLDEILRVLPWIHLALGVLLAATGSLFLICKYDPFVGIFRMAGPRAMLIGGAAMIGLSMVLGRPYCRYLCPYGALLGVAARFAKWRPTVTPTTCTQCRLCETACPFGALNQPEPPRMGQQRIASARQRMVLLAVMIPLAAVLFGWLGGKVGLASLPIHPDGRLAGLILQDSRGELPTPVPDEILAFRQHSGDRQAAFRDAAALEARFFLLGRVIGAAFGLVMALKLARILFPETSSDYETDHGRCVSCARCFSACPYELVRRGVPVPLPAKGGPSA
jgi:NosR/NirI family nitrous oxide reductase transcriptional regulator